ncbi:MAG TPA: MBL fold metallo-hydrolase [Hyphomicrobiaceae bacterium]|nr:MBL fold metallo-hydrolase [Hyphomicrobiaceae bacterium]
MADDLHLKTDMTFAYGVAATLVPDVMRLVCENPGPFTFKGTNTYLVGSSALAVIDPGPRDDKHIADILKAADGKTISHILITHTHRDHVDNAQALKDATGAVTCGYQRTGAARGNIERSPSGTEFVDIDFNPDIQLRHGDEISGAGWTLSALHTPGHAPDHVCYALKGRDIIFSGDHVMAWNTTVVAPPEGRMADYLASLQLLLERGESLYLPGHGGRIEDATRMVKAYLLHRRWREQAIITAIRDGRQSVREVASLIYANLDPKLHTAALLSVMAHVEHLIEREIITGEGPLSFDQRLSSR